MTNQQAAPPVLRCSFCNCANDKGRKIVTGRSMTICEDCVRICYELVLRDESEPPAPPPAPDCA